jgi:N-acetylmuramoyl-L-alanine amidase
MKRLTLAIVGALLALASLVVAQSASQAVLRTPAGDRPVTTRQISGTTYFAADEVLAALGGSTVGDANGFKATLNNVVAAFGPDSRFAVVRDDLIEMPVSPQTIDGRPFVPWQFFQGFFARAAQQDVQWDPAAHVLAVRPAQQSAVAAQVSVANVQGISKVVVTLSAAVDYSIVREADAYTIRFRSLLRAPYAEQAHEDPYVTKTSITGSDVRIQLSGPDVVGDAYRLDNPFRIVVDLRKGAAPAPGVQLPVAPAKPVDQPGIRTIVIDPGHGGKEVGAIGPGGLMEKQATLTLSRKLAAALESKLKTRVILTRNDDSVVPLDQRTSIANQYHADLFLSVHMNAAIVKGAHGAETYFLSLEASDELAKKAAELENAAAPSAAPANPANELKLILWDLAQQEYLSESSKLAQNIQQEMNRITGVQNRGVKQAPFRVLIGATMPAALVEVAFITNAEEEAKINSDDFQSKVVDALTTAVERYKLDYETRIGLVQPPAPVPAPATTTTTAAPPKKAGT